MSERGAIRNRKYSAQVKDFTGLQYEKITPTDIDLYLEFANKLSIFGELKYGGSSLPLGQRLALERLADDVSASGKVAISLIIEHTDQGDIDVANAIVTEYRWRGKWRTLNDRVTARAVVDGLRARHLHSAK